MKDESEMEWLRGLEADSEGSGFFGGGFGNGAHGKLCLLQPEELLSLSALKWGKLERTAGGS